MQAPAFPPSQLHLFHFKRRSNATTFTSPCGSVVTAKCGHTGEATNDHGDPNAACHHKSSQVITSHTSQKHTSGTIWGTIIGCLSRVKNDTTRLRGFDRKSRDVQNSRSLTLTRVPCCSQQPFPVDKSYGTCLKLVFVSHKFFN